MNLKEIYNIKKFEEGKKYVPVTNDKQIEGYKFWLENGVLMQETNNEIFASRMRYNDLNKFSYKEIIDTNSHWKRSDDDLTCCIPLNERWNNFHWEDRDKVKCLTLEMEIKSVLLNWRRLHDDVELGWEDDTAKYYCSRNYRIFNEGNYGFETWEMNSGIGYFSKSKKAHQFYDYMKDDIDRYFKMRKELKF